MLKTLLLLPTLTASTGALTNSINQQSSNITTNYNLDDEVVIAVENLFTSVSVSTHGSPGYRNKESDKQLVIAWKEYAENRSEFFEKYPTVKLDTYAILGEKDILYEKKVDGNVKFSTKELFGGYFKKYINSDSHEMESYKVGGDTYVIGESDDRFCYLKVGAYVEGQWDTWATRNATASIKITSVTFSTGS